MADRPSEPAVLAEHTRTYARVTGLFKWLIIAVAFILLGLLVFVR